MLEQNKLIEENRHDTAQKGTGTSVTGVFQKATRPSRAWFQNSSEPTRGLPVSDPFAGKLIIYRRE
jgi:hypothetical protein